MRAGVAESCPVIIAYHMRSHPEAVSHCSRPLSTHPPPVRTACPAQDFWGGMHSSATKTAAALIVPAHSGTYQECAAAMAGLGEHGAAPRRCPKVRTHKDVGSEQFYIIS